MSINHDHLRRVVAEMEQGVAATTKYSWLDLAQEILRLQKEITAMEIAWLDDPTIDFPGDHQ